MPETTMPERREVVRAVADEMASWLGTSGGRVVLIRDDEGRHRGEGVLAVDARVLRAVADAASDDEGDVLHVFVQSAIPSPQEGGGGIEVRWCVRFASGIESSGWSDEADAQQVERFDAQARRMEDGSDG